MYGNLESVTRAVSTRYIFVYVLLSIAILPTLGIPVIVCYLLNYTLLNEMFRVKLTLFRRVTLLVATSCDDRKFYLGERAFEISYLISLKGIISFYSDGRVRLYRDDFIDLNRLVFLVRSKSFTAVQEVESHCSSCFHIRFTSPLPLCFEADCFRPVTKT